MPRTALKEPLKFIQNTVWTMSRGISFGDIFPNVLVKVRSGRLMISEKEEDKLTTRRSLYPPQFQFYFHYNGPYVVPEQYVLRLIHGLYICIKV